jgi:hypothetical protein
MKDEIKHKPKMKTKINLIGLACWLTSAFILQPSSLLAYPPAPASQAQVNAGTEPYLYVTPATLTGSTGWRGATNLSNPNIIFLRTNGVDSTASIGDEMHPARTFTNAVAIANSHPPALIKVGVGTFLAVSNTLTANVSVIGEGGNLTFVTMSPAATQYGIILNGDNITLKDFTFGTNPANGTYHYPLNYVSGTNLLIEGLSLFGDADILQCTGISNRNGVIKNSTFNDGYDTAVLGPNCFIRFVGDTFNVQSDPNFGNMLNRGVVIGSGAATFQDCTFNITNTETVTPADYIGAAAAGIYVSSSLGSATVLSGNSFNVDLPNNGADNSYGIFISAGALTIDSPILAINLLAIGGTVTYSQKEFHGSGHGMTNIPYAKTFTSTNGYFTFSVNTDGSTNVTFIVTNVAYAQITGTPALGSAALISSNAFATPAQLAAGTNAALGGAQVIVNSTNTSLIALLNAASNTLATATKAITNNYPTVTVTNVAGYPPGTTNREVFINGVLSTNINHL